MSDRTPTDTKPSRQPRKSAPRRRKPANGNTVTASVGKGEAEGTSGATDATAGAPETGPTPPPTGTATLPTRAETQEEVATPKGKRRLATQSKRQHKGHPAAHEKDPATSAPPRQERPGKPSAASRLTASPEVAAAPAVPRALIAVPLDVRWRDLDAFNHVNNSKYLSYLEEARLQWMLTMPGQGLDDHVAPVVAAAHLNYRRPIEWPNAVIVELFVERLGNTSVSIGHRIVARDDTSVVYCDGNVVLVWIDRGTGAAAPLPVEVRTACR